jgi:hypothetical protein
MAEADNRLNLIQFNVANELIPNERGLTLCDEAENRLAKALGDMAFVLVNGLMLVKMVGVQTALALREEELSGGTTELGAWYEIEYGPHTVYDPIHSERWKRSAVHEAFLRGSSRIIIPGVTRWFKLREVRDNEVGLAEDLNSVLIQTANNLRDNIPMPNGISRETYLQDNVIDF